MNIDICCSNVIYFCKLKPMYNANNEIYSFDQEIIESKCLTEKIDLNKYLIPNEILNIRICPHLILNNTIEENKKILDLILIENPIEHYLCIKECCTTEQQIGFNLHIFNTTKSEELININFNPKLKIFIETIKTFYSI